MRNFVVLTYSVLYVFLGVNALIMWPFHQWAEALAYFILAGGAYALHRRFSNQ